MSCRRWRPPAGARWRRGVAWRCKALGQLQSESLLPCPALPCPTLHREEYDPAKPNDYEAVCRAREQQRREAEAEAARQERLRAEAEAARLAAEAARAEEDRLR